MVTWSTSINIHFCVDAHRGRLDKRAVMAVVKYLKRKLRFERIKMYSDSSKYLKIKPLGFCLVLYRL